MKMRAGLKEEPEHRPEHRGHDEGREQAARQVGDDEVRDPREEDDAGGEAVEPVDEVDRVDDADDPGDRHREGEDPHREGLAPGELDRLDAKAAGEGDHRHADLRVELVERSDSPQVVEDPDQAHHDAAEAQAGHFEDVRLEGLGDDRLDEEEADDGREEREANGHAAEPRDRGEVHVARPGVRYGAPPERQPAHDRREHGGHDGRDHERRDVAPHEIVPPMVSCSDPR
jgi:hypothetical protein